MVSILKLVNKHDAAVVNLLQTLDADGQSIAQKFDQWRRV